MRPETQTVDVDRLAAGVVGELDLLGARRRVRAPNGGAYKRAMALQSNPDPLAAYALAAWFLPDLTEEQVDTLEIPQVMAVITFACGGIAAVEALYPNGIRPADGAEGTPPASLPDSPSTT